jgi:hypothetical protein
VSLKTDLSSISPGLFRGMKLRTAAGEASATDAATIAIMAESFMMLTGWMLASLVRVFGSDSFRGC